VSGSRDRRSRQAPRRFAVAALVPAAAACAALSADALVERRIESEACAFAASAVILGIGAALVGAAPSSRWPALLSRYFAPLVALQWLAIAAIPAVTFAPNGWDEGSYLLSGLAIRGYKTPYAAHRPPVTGLLCALFADAPRWINLLLVLVLIAVVGWWARRLWSWRDAAWVLLILGCQNLMVTAAVDVMAELPAAITFALAFYFIDRDSPFLAGLALGACVLTRWNMAVAIAPMILALGVRSGAAAAARMAAGCALPMAVWYVATAAAGYAPLDGVLAHFYGARDYAHPGGPVPNVFVRSREYLPRFLMLTPLGLLSLLWSPCLRGSARDTVLRWHAPVAVLVVVVSLLFVGAIEPRFFTPVVPIVALVLWRVVRQFLAESSLSEDSARLVRHLAVIVTCAFGVWPGHAAAYVAQNAAYVPPFSPGFLAVATEKLATDEEVSMPATPGQVSKGGHDVMYWLRRTVRFPAAAFDERGTTLADSDEARAVCALLAAVPSGSAVVIPRRACEAAPACHSIELIATDRDWVLGRSAGIRPTCPSG
jgi:hypothetical protein